MAGGYGSQPEGVDWIIERFARIESMLSAMNGANPAESIVVHGPDGITAYDPDTGTRLQYARGALYFWDNYDDNPDNYGILFCDAGAGSNILRMYPPFADGNGSENSITTQGRRAGQNGNVWVYSDGQITNRVQDPNGNLVGAIYNSAAEVNSYASGGNYINGAAIYLTAPELGLYSLPTTSAGANLHLGTVGGKWTVAYVTSSRRYKQDIADATIDPDAVLSWRPRTWRDKAEVEAVGDEATEHIGFIAEEIHDATPEFVVTDDEGRPDSLKYDRMVAGLVALAQKQDEQIAALLDALAAQGARIEALEAT